MPQFLETQSNRSGVQVADRDTILTGFPVGRTHETDSCSHDGKPPCEALVAVIRSRLDGRPCLVEFSGGCDSSLVLAAAVRACAEMGHAPPVPVTDRFSGIPSTDETAFQEMMVEHLGLREWIIRTNPEVDLLGSASRDFLASHGVVWPFTIGVRASLLREAKGALLLSGEGGDEVLGHRRIAHALVGAAGVRHRGTRRRGLRIVLNGSRNALSRGRPELPWLVNGERNRLEARLRDEIGGEPLRPGRAVSEYFLRRAGVTIALQNLDSQAEAAGVELGQPLLDPRFVRSLESSLRWTDYRGRGHVLDKYFDDLLPEQIRWRSSKAVFNSVYFGPECRRFVSSWDGRGLPADAVDVEWLRREWATPAPHSGTMLLLQAAWLYRNTGRQWW